MLSGYPPTSVASFYPSRSSQDVLGIRRDFVDFKAIEFFVGIIYYI
jgi:hypothetical protein